MACLNYSSLLEKWFHNETRDVVLWILRYLYAVGSKWCQRQQSMMGMWAVLVAVGTRQLMFVPNLLDQRKRCPDDLLCCPYHSLESRYSTAVLHQNVLYGASIESGKDGRGEVWSYYPAEKVQLLVLLVKKYLSVMCTPGTWCSPPHSWLLFISSGEWQGWLFQKSTMISFVL